MASLSMSTARRLGATELLADVLQQQGANISCYTSILVSTMPISKILPEALSLIVQSQPLMRMCIATDAAKKHAAKRFVEIDDFKPDIHIELGAERLKWVTYIQQQLEIPFEGEMGPLWRAAYIENDAQDVSSRRSSIQSLQSLHTGSAADNYSMSSLASGAYEVQGALIFTMHPAICDALSMESLIHSQLIPALNHLLVGLNVTASSMNICPCVDDSFLASNDTLSWSKRRTMKNSLKKSVPEVSHTPRVKTHSYASNTSSFRTCFLARSLNRNISKKILQNSETLNIPIHDIIAAASSLVLGLLSPSASAQTEDILCGNVADLRQFHSFSTRQQPLGLWYSNTVTKLQSMKEIPSSEAFWNLVKSVPKKTSPKKPWSSLTTSKELIKYINSDHLRELFAINKPHIECESVIGTSENLRQAIVSAVEHYTVKSFSDMSGVSLAIRVCVINKRITLCVSCDRCWISDDYLYEYNNLLHKILKDVVGSTNSMSVPQSLNTLPPALRAQALGATGQQSPTKKRAAVPWKSSSSTSSEQNTTAQEPRMFSGSLSGQSYSGSISSSTFSSGTTPVVMNTLGKTTLNLPKTQLFASQPQRKMSFEQDPDGLSRVTPQSIGSKDTFHVSSGNTLHLAAANNNTLTRKKPTPILVNKDNPVSNTLTRASPASIFVKHDEPDVKTLSQAISAVSVKNDPPVDSTLPKKSTEPIIVKLGDSASNTSTQKAPTGILKNEQPLPNSLTRSTSSLIDETGSQMYTGSVSSGTSFTSTIRPLIRSVNTVPPNNHQPITAESAKNVREANIEVVKKRRPRAKVFDTDFNVEQPQIKDSSPKDNDSTEEENKRHVVIINNESDDDKEKQPGNDYGSKTRDKVTGKAAVVERPDKTQQPRRRLGVVTSSFQPEKDILDSGTNVTNLEQQSSTLKSNAHTVNLVSSLANTNEEPKKERKKKKSVQIGETRTISFAIDYDSDMEADEDNNLAVDHRMFEMPPQIITERL